MTISISKQADWQSLTKQGLSVVVDPMVFRCGELFMNGVSSTTAPGETWELLTKNIHALAMFFDCLIVNEKVPVFNYGDTFDMTLNFDQRVLARINDFDQVLYDIDVTYGPYHEVKSAALVELAKLYSGPNKIKEGMAHDILAELSIAGYAWNPSIEHLDHELPSLEEKRLAAFLLGALVFGGYSQQMESEHILQPKRSRILLALAVSAESAEHRFEDDLFGELKKRAVTPCEDLPWVPTFFPYLLAKADTPKAILQEVVSLRRSSEIRDYRIWLREVMEDWKRNGRISVQKIKDIQTIAKHVDRILGVVSSAPKVELKATVTDVVAGKLPGSVDLTPTIGRLWGWFLENLPGNRYQKILTRALIADHEYKRLDFRTLSVWKAG